MEILLATQALIALGGSETYAITVADHLQRLGHEVTLYAMDDGAAGDHARALGIPVTVQPRDLPADPDVLLVQDGAVAYELAAHYPRVAQVFVAHSDTFDLQLPPSLPEMIAAVVTLYDRVDQRIHALGTEAPVVRLSQPVDVQRFKPTSPLRDRPRVALALGNYLHGERLAMVRAACERASIELVHIGRYAGGETTEPQVAFNDADIVFGKARVIYEAMACGRAAYVLDHNGGEGWVTAENQSALSADNFGGQSRPVAIDEERLVADLAQYDPAMGLVNRDYIVGHHAATKHVAALVEVLRGVAPRSAPVDAPLRELSRMVRQYHRVDAQAFGLHAQLERATAQSHALESEIQALRLQLADQAARLGAETAAAQAARQQAQAARQEAETARQDAEARALAADDARRAFTDLVATRRWRTLQAALRPADRVRLALRSRGTAGAAGAPPPAPFIVGIARSGTTLLRLQLDAHSQVAIPPETGFGLIAGELARAGAAPEQLADRLTSLETWPDFGLDETGLRTLLATIEPWSVGAGLRAVYRSYAARHGKPRWGDKTPVHYRYMDALAETLPEARFIHVIRDGRDVAASVGGLHFAPGDGSIEAAAADWRDGIVHARRLGAGLPQYHEIRYEHLVADPERTLREVCGFLELEFEPGMLSAHESARQRLNELPEVRTSGGTSVTREERLTLDGRTCEPPDPSRAGRWRTDLAPDAVARFEAVAGDLLAELGYDTRN